MTYIRRSAWNNGGTFTNPDLLWYAKGIAELQSRALSDPSSWWFFAAIHGIQLEPDQETGKYWGNVQGPPAVPTSPVPDKSTQDKFWNQCQHGSWYFAPWHRGYLIALEAQIRAAISSMEGAPNDWALPYWNYFENNNMPPAFSEKVMPDGSPNPLYVYERFGTDGKGNVVIPIGNEKGEVSDTCQTNDTYISTDFTTGYGGPVTGFEHPGAGYGSLEQNPHNRVHMLVGGNGGEPLEGGLMTDPDYAGLDPIFYLHHCNIDRMWAAWNGTGYQNPTDLNWLNGPASTGEREFIMPMPENPEWIYTPEDMTSLSTQNYKYDTLEMGTIPTPLEAHTIRLQKLGIQSNGTLLGRGMKSQNDAELVGANEEKIQLNATGTKATVKLDKQSWENVPKSLMKASATSIPDRVYVRLENVRGNMDSNMLTILVNQKPISSFALFGLRNASKQDEHHAGAGLTFVLDITDIIDDMHLGNTLDISTLDINIETEHPIPSHKNISVERIAVYRVKQ